MRKAVYKEDLLKLKAMTRYHRYNGKEALLKKQAREKRKAAMDPTIM